MAVRRPGHLLEMRGLIPGSSPAMTFRTAPLNVTPTKVGSSFEPLPMKLDSGFRRNDDKQSEFLLTTFLVLCI
jgi:hypothetical protein